MKMNKTIKLFFLLQLMLAVSLCFNLTYQQFLDSTPKKFGLLTVTHSRDGDYSVFQKYIGNYASMECPVLTEICVVWNNEISPEEAGFVKDQKWVRPVYFIKTAYNSMDFRYMVPKESKVKVFFSIDDDIHIDCTQLSLSFKQWQAHAIGDIAPLMSYGPRGFDFFSKNSEFKYSDPGKKNIFSLLLIGIAWVPRFYLDLYNTDRNWQIHQMRQIVRQKNNCDDIALNFIVNYFFPQLISIALEGKIKLDSPSYSQGFTKTHYSYRSQCIGNFTKIMGYNPLRLVFKQEEKNTNQQERYLSPLLKQTVYLKRKELGKKFLTDEKGKDISTDYFLKVFEKLKDEHPDKVYTPQVLTDLKDAQTSSSSSKSQIYFEQIDLLKNQVKKLKSIINKLQSANFTEMAIVNEVIQSIPPSNNNNNYLFMQFLCLTIIVISTIAIFFIILKKN